MNCGRSTSRLASTAPTGSAWSSADPGRLPFINSPLWSCGHAPTMRALALDIDLEEIDRVAVSTEEAQVIAGSAFHGFMLRTGHGFDGVG